MEEAPLPPLADRKLVAGGDMLMQRIGGEVYGYVMGRTLPHSHIHVEEKYSKFLYTSRFAFSVPRSMRSVEEAAPDHVLAFVHDGLVYTKGGSTHIASSSDGMIMEWSPCRGIQVRTEILLLSDGHRRIHTIDSSISCTAYDCGAALPWSGEASFEKTEAKAGIRWGKEEKDQCGIECVRGDGEPVLIAASPNTNLLEPKTSIPAIVYSIRPGVKQGVLGLR